MQIYPEKKEFLRLSEEFNVIPLYAEIPADLETPISLFYKLFDQREELFLFESMEGPEKWARYSFVGFDPFIRFRSKEQNIEIDFGGSKNLVSPDPLGELKRILKTFKAPKIKDLPRFWGGAVGYVSYEMVSFFEKRVPRGIDTINFYDLNFIFPRKILIYDHIKHTYLILNLIFIEQGNPEILYMEGKEELKALGKEIAKIKVKAPRLKKRLKLYPEIERDSFLKMVQRAKEYISAGDIIQTVLSQRFYLEDDILYDPHTSFYLYRGLRRINPSPYMFYLKLGEEILIGASPEILLRVEDDRIETRPIAGTRRRGQTEEEDLLLEAELKQDEKELAEHIMLVDLGRNDLGRVSRYGTVEVYDLLTVERYSHVMHLVSGVRGLLREGEDMFSAFRACFPAGTVSGAPKIRAMEIIWELEKKARGPYAGAVGYFGFSENMDFCITIRTFFQKGNRLYLQAGAGIVADSQPDKEYEETINKAKALEKALELFGEGYFL